MGIRNISTVYEVTFSLTKQYGNQTADERGGEEKKKNLSLELQNMME